MFIGGLNWETTDGQLTKVAHNLTDSCLVDGLKNYMSQYGYVESCTIMRDANGRSRGFAFLTYSDPDSVTRVMGDTHHLDGKQVGCRLRGGSVIDVVRLIPNELYPKPSTSGQPRSLLAVSLLE